VPGPQLDDVIVGMRERPWPEEQGRRERAPDEGTPLCAMPMIRHDSPRGGY
jgi:hypothetical protein